MGVSDIEVPAAETANGQGTNARKPGRRLAVAAAAVAAAAGLLVGGLALTQGEQGPADSDLVTERPAYTSWPDFIDGTDVAREAATRQFGNGADAVKDGDLAAAAGWWRTSADSIRAQAVSPSEEFNEAMMRQAWHLDAAADALGAGDGSGASEQLDLVGMYGQEAADIMDRDISEAVSFIEEQLGLNP